MSVKAVFDAVRGRETPPELAEALIEFATRMSARRSGAPVVFTDRTGKSPIDTALDETAIRRLNASKELGQHSETVERVTGRLFEANVEADEAHVRTPTGESVKVQFASGLEPEIKRLLGDRASLVGEVEYDPCTHRVREIRASSVDSGVQLEFEGVDFWRDPSLAELATAVGATAVGNPSDLHIDATDAEWDDRTLCPCRSKLVRAGS